jgi:Pentapeptide repeats (8 copies)/Fibronectin type III domain
MSSPAEMPDCDPMCAPQATWRQVATIGLVAVVGMCTLLVASAVTAGARTPRIKKPGAPLAVVASPTSGGANVSWSPPTSDGGSPITGYTVTVGRVPGCSTSGALSCTVSGFINGKAYFVYVQASNIVGLGKKTRVSLVPGQGPDCSEFSPGADLQYCKLKDANMVGVDLSGANLYRASLYGANLSGANLSDVTFTGADLNYANLADTDVAGAIFDTTDPSLPDHITSGGVVGTPAVFPPDWGLVDGYLVGPVADLAGADLAGADLADFDLLDVNLTGADLSGADLTGVIWSHTICPDGTTSNNDGGTCVNNLG